VDVDEVQRWDSRLATGLVRGSGLAAYFAAKTDYYKKNENPLVFL
jgi:hypothetical protein